MKAKRKKPFSAMNASTKKLTEEGWTIAPVEQSFSFGKIKFKRDAFGFGDMLCCSPSRGIMLVQVTGGQSSSNASARIAKIKAEPRAGIWLACGGRIQVHSWQGKGKDRQCHITNIIPENQE